MLPTNSTEPYPSEFVERPFSQTLLDLLTTEAAVCLAFNNNQHQTQKGGDSSQLPTLLLLCSECLLLCRQVGVCYGAIGLMPLLLGDGGGATGNYIKALILRERSEGAQSVLTAGCHQALAEALLQEGSKEALAEALPHRIRALAPLHVWSNGGVETEIPLIPLSAASGLMPAAAQAGDGASSVEDVAGGRVAFFEKKGGVVLIEERRRAEAAVRCVRLAATAARELSSCEGSSVSEVRSGSEKWRLSDRLVTSTSKRGFCCERSSQAFAEVWWGLESLGSLREAVEFMQLARNALRRETADADRLKVRSNAFLFFLQKSAFMHQQQQRGSSASFFRRPTNACPARRDAL